jgi:hypothetical protein
MPREAKLFSSSSGSVVRGFLKYRANIPPRWIRNARTSRKRIGPEIVKSLGSLKRLRKTRPRAQVAIKNASKEMRAVLNRWEMAYNNENFYRGIRVLLELERNGSSNLSGGFRQLVLKSGDAWANLTSASVSCVIEKCLARGSHRFSHLRPRQPEILIGESRNWGSSSF